MIARFPDDFLWGVATSAYQIEGFPLADGAGPSIWHRFAHTPGRVAGNDTGDLACDHYHRYREDVALMAELGLNLYRFSLAWGRVLPEGWGAVNRLGLDFYARLVDALLEQGIRPMATLYHWDLPVALHERGGWLNPDSPHWFADYAETLFRALDDRVPFWITLNEPWVIAVPGYLDGQLAPGHRDLFEPPRVAHHLLLAHAEAVAAYRALGHHEIGVAVNLEPQYPASSAPSDLEAARRRDSFVNRWFLDAILFGRYPEELADIFGPAWPEFPDESLARIRCPGDFIGVNYYSRGLVRAAPGSPPLNAIRVTPPDAELTAMGWEVYPQGLTETLVWLKDRYANPPLYITENGAAYDDPPPRAGLVEDPRRIAYLREHILAAATALEQGVDLRGYCVWSLLDNFEWAEGYSKRFGLYRVDRTDLRRWPKASAGFYRDVIRSRGAIVFRASAPPTAGCAADAVPRDATTAHVSRAD
ncbi:GH1 family beta-glucosidase [Thermochromatium tepidum]|uniref:Beta-glucosidase n=1 Tax=Thermochromatium tepidum ATCC 43061 TaxID=316276 RepID=A0A6I6DW70_THETI|nr:GH1 family beta-glucosidase [Thermochromatium tepidum]QGU31721.1 beta-glucosidase [Thermochromatium tepidum ATCC 43061]